MFVIEIEKVEFLLSFYRKREDLRTESGAELSLWIPGFYFQVDNWRLEDLSFGIFVKRIALSHSDLAQPCPLSELRIIRVPASLIIWRTRTHSSAVVNFYLSLLSSPKSRKRIKFRMWAAWNQKTVVFYLIPSMLQSASAVCSVMKFSVTTRTSQSSPGWSSNKCNKDPDGPGLTISRQLREVLKDSV